MCPSCVVIQEYILTSDTNALMIKLIDKTHLHSYKESFALVTGIVALVADHHCNPFQQRMNFYQWSGCNRHHEGWSAMAVDRLDSVIANGVVHHNWTCTDYTQLYVHALA